jgi:dCMP deaminase
MYVALFPCNECAKMIIQSGIKSVVYMSDKYSDVNKFIASRRMLNMANVKLRQFIPKQSSITINFI